MSLALKMIACSATLPIIQLQQIMQQCSISLQSAMGFKVCASDIQAMARQSSVVQNETNISKSYIPR